jgi:hypothetical protein
MRAGAHAGRTRAYLAGAGKGIPCPACPPPGFIASIAVGKAAGAAAHARIDLDRRRAGDRGPRLPCARRGEWTPVPGAARVAARRRRTCLCGVLGRVCTGDWASRRRRKRREAVEGPRRSRRHGAGARLAGGASLGDCSRAIFAVDRWQCPLHGAASRRGRGHPGRRGHVRVARSARRCVVPTRRDTCLWRGFARAGHADDPPAALAGRTGAIASLAAGRNAARARRRAVGPVSDSAVGSGGRGAEGGKGRRRACGRRQSPARACRRGKAE